MKISLNNNIYSITYSLYNDKLFACDFNEKCFYIFEMNLENKIFKILEQFEINSCLKNDYYKKCIEINSNLLATIDNNNYISLWEKTDNNKYNKMKPIILPSNPKDLLFIEDKLLIASLKKSIIFIDIQNYKIIVQFKNIDLEPINNNYLFLYKNNIIANCTE